LALAGILGISSRVVTSKYYPLTVIDRVALEPTTRGQVDEEYDRACGLVALGKYTEAIRAFERFIRAYPGDDLRYLAEYSAGATYLLLAHRSIGPFFPSYDVETVIRGLGHLQRAAEASGNRRIVEEAHWLRAKGFLMMDEPAGAVAELRIVESMHGSKKDDATGLLKSLVEIDGDNR
jgi:tetratricopeptide (TPR) repeat protein